MIEAPPHDLLPLLRARTTTSSCSTSNPLGNQYMFRMNWLHPPFDNQKVREAALAALNQEDFLKAAIGDPRYYKICKPRCSSAARRSRPSRAARSC